MANKQVKDFPRTTVLNQSDVFLMQDTNGNTKSVEANKIMTPATEIVNDPTTGGATKALSAEAGKNIHDKVETLKQESNEKFEEVNSSLDNIVNESIKNSDINYNIPTTVKGYMTIIDDDVRADVWTKLRPISQEKGIPITLAVPINYKNGVAELTQEQLLQLQSEGWELASHTYNHLDLTKCTDSELFAEIALSKSELSKKGYKIKNMVYPYGSGSQDRCKKLSSLYYNCGVRVGGGINTIPVKSFMLNRVALGSSFDASDTTGQGLNTSSLEYYKAVIDKVVATNGWVIFMTHCATAEHNETQQQYIRDLIDYAKSKSVSICNLNDGYEVFGNIVEVGDKITITKNGDFIGDIGNNLLYLVNDSAINTNTPLTNFTANKISICNFSFSVAENNFPTRKAGTLMTYKNKDYSYSYQYWYPYLTNDSENATPPIWFRRAKTDSTWYSWVNINAKTSITKNSISIPSFTVQAGKTNTLEIVVPSMTFTNGFTLSPSFAVANELMWSLRLKDATTMRITFFNPATSDLSIPTSAWQLCVI